MHEPEEISVTPAEIAAVPAIPADAGATPRYLPGQLTVVVHDEPEATVVTVAGEVDLLSAPRLAGVLDGLARTNARDIAIDLTQTTFIDSSGVHALLQAHEHATGHVAVICGQGPVLRTLDLLGLTEPLNVVPSLEEYKLRRSGS
jgi:anti-anti-sigma factor